MAVAPDSIHRVESIEEVDALPAFEQPVALLAQTTLSHRDWSAVADHTAERFPELWMPGRSDLCFATTNRPSALGALAARCSAGAGSAERRVGHKGVSTVRYGWAP